MKRSILIGAATGILSQSGIAAIVLNTPPERLPKIMRSPWEKRIALVFAGGEIVTNAFVSSLPPRTTPGPLLGRIAMGAGNAALLAHVNRQPLALPAATGGASAAVTATVATKGRARFAKVLPDILFAIAETVVAILLATRATR
jgi:hypothetical protein